MILIVKYHITNMLYRFRLVLLRTLITYISVMFFVVLKLHENKDGLGLLYVVPSCMKSTFPDACSGFGKVSMDALQIND